jgi:uncharacterized protein
LFNIIASFFLLFLLFDTITSISIPISISAPVSQLISAPSVGFMLGAALLILLSAVHVHYMMVRADTSPIQKLLPRRVEFVAIVQDILLHEEFVRLKDYRHHTNHIYDHVNRVAYISYCIAKVLSLDYAASARGGMLHDFFLYDWRERKATDNSKALHGREHPRIALENARRYFPVSEREADSILKHMFPKTSSPPRYLESAVVSLSDKIATVIEYFCHLACRRR